MLKECQISDLINQSGRLRMLSHRAAMMLAQLGAGVEDEWFMDEMIISINKFENGYTHVQGVIASEPKTKQSFLELISHLEPGRDSIKEIVNTYLSGIKSYQAAAKAKRLPSSDQLSDFLRFVSTDLLVALNQIVAFFEDILNQISDIKLKNIGHLARDIEASIDEVDQINLSIKILSFNASVEAARAGEVGKGFAVVSKEMNSLSSNTRRVTQNVKDTVNSFVEELNS